MYRRDLTPTEPNSGSVHPLERCSRGIPYGIPSQWWLFARPQQNDIRSRQGQQTGSRPAARDGKERPRQHIFRDTAVSLYTGVFLRLAGRGVLCGLSSSSRAVLTRIFTLLYLQLEVATCMRRRVVI